MAELHVLRVFCDENGDYGNPLGVVLDGGDVPAAERQAVAATLGFSETVFVDDRTSATLQIFTPAVELPLAGHPLVGTSWLLRQAAIEAGDEPVGETVGDTAGEPIGVSVLRPPAGDVPTGADDDGAWIVAGPHDAPPFDLVQLSSAAEVEALEVRRGADVHEDVWAWVDVRERTRIRCRVFADAVGIPEDEATGSAALRLVAELGHPVTIVQGRGSMIDGAPVTNGRVRIGGRVVLDRRADLDVALRDRRG